MKAPNIIIMAAGKSKRWTGEKPKQLTEFDGEPLLYRTIRLLEKRGFIATITVSEQLLGHLDPALLRGFATYLPENNRQEIDRFLSCRDLWGDDTLFLYGDVYYTERSISEILGRYTAPATFYGRRGRNSVKPYGEMFALRANTSGQLFHVKLQEIRTREISGNARGLGWDVFRAYEKRNFVEIDPRVEDFDKIEEVTIYKNLYGIH